MRSIFCKEVTGAFFCCFLLFVGLSGGTESGFEDESVQRSLDSFPETEFDLLANLKVVEEEVDGEVIRPISLKRVILEEKKKDKISGNSSFPILKYLSNEALEEYLKAYVERCGSISHLYSIGKSVGGLPLWVLEISNKPSVEEAEPSFKFLGNIHGDEPLGRQLLLYLADWLCDNYKKDERATLIVDNAHLHLLPSLNPDGFKARLRNNLNDVDLNRDFPDQFVDTFNNEELRQPEVQAIMTWSREKRFTASASLHEGALVANYPWDGGMSRKKEYAKCPDDGTFRALAQVYSQAHSLMKNSSEFEKGITNGANWYPVYGGMQDWNYIKTGCLELTLEINEQKWPPIQQLSYLWKLNRDPMLSLVQHVIMTGIHGVITSTFTGKPITALVKVAGIDKDVSAHPSTGYFHRLLIPGSYHVTVVSEGHKPKGTIITIVEGAPTIMDFSLDLLESLTEVKSRGGGGVGVGMGKGQVGTWSEASKPKTTGQGKGLKRIQDLARKQLGDKKVRVVPMEGSRLSFSNFDNVIWPGIETSVILAGVSVFLLIGIALVILGGRKRSRVLKLSSL